MAVDKTLDFKGDFIGGKFVLPDNGDEDWDVPSPANRKDIVIRPEAKFDHVDRAVQAARKAYLPWAHLGLEKRREHMLRLKEVFLSRSAELAEIISRETGKPLWETKGEAAALANKIDITVSYSMELVAEEEIKDALPGISGFIRHKPSGVMSV